METILINIMVFSFVGYLFAISNKYGVREKPLKSISAGYYDLPEKLRWLTFIAYAGFCVPAMILAQTVLIFLACSAIMFTAAAAAYRLSDTTMKVHIWSANIGIALAQVSIIIDFGMWWYTLIFAIPSLILYLLKVYTRVYWIEILAFVTTIMAIVEYVN